jgi:hypothetical protein
VGAFVVPENVAVASRSARAFEATVATIPVTKVVTSRRAETHMERPPRSGIPGGDVAAPR